MGITILVRWHLWSIYVLILKVAFLIHTGPTFGHHCTCRCPSTSQLGHQQAQWWLHSYTFSMKFLGQEEILGYIFWLDNAIQNGRRDLKESHNTLSVKTRISSRKVPCHQYTPSTASIRNISMTFGNLESSEMPHDFPGKLEVFSDPTGPFFTGHIDDRWSNVIFFFFLRFWRIWGTLFKGESPGKLSYSQSCTVKYITSEK